MEPGVGFEVATHRGLIVLGLLTLILKSLIFAPISWWPLAFVCLVPWLLMVGGATLAPRVYLHSYLMGLVFFLINVRWLYPATGAGYVAMAVYLAAYFPLMACAVRSIVRRRRWPLAVAVPFVWVGCEMLRAVVISGFPWFYLSHSLHGVLTLIQISDLVGAYGVSFVVAAVNGAIADVIIARSAARRADSTKVPGRSWRFSAAFAGSLLVVTTVYGWVRLSQDTISPGPRVAVLQGDFVNAVYDQGASEEEKRRVYLGLIDEASKEKPDLYLLPESPWSMYLNKEARDYFASYRESYTQLRGRAMRDRAYLVTGSASYVKTPYDLLATERRYNSATIFNPEGTEPERYDKVHLVYFGEVVPFRFGRLRFVYFWLNKLMPFSDHGKREYSIFPGEGFRTFSMNPTSQPGESYSFGVPICYEDVMPYVSREFVSGGGASKRVDLLLNISNDGWFGRGVQQPQHLAICVFRAVENRVGIARAVNTGVSAFIRPDGRVHDVVTGDPNTTWPGVSGFSVANVGVDSRYSFYSRHGDWFAWLCALVWLAIFLDYWVIRVRTRGDG